MKPLVLLRPEPGLSQSVERARALGLEVIAVPLFAVEPISWTAPDPAAFDALLVTSANAVRLAGRELDRLRSLAVHAVGAASARAARDAGLVVASTGSNDAAALLETLPPGLRLLHVCGRDRRLPPTANVTAVEVYRADALAAPDMPDLRGTVIAGHSPRAAERLAQLCRTHPTAQIAAISAAAAAACGAGWGQVAVADQPTDASLLALAARLCDTRSR
jgi:uroporphyrinogen-III synthase